MGDVDWNSLLKPRKKPEEDEDAGGAVDWASLMKPRAAAGPKLGAGVADELGMLPQAQQYAEQQSLGTPEFVGYTPDKLDAYQKIRSRGERSLAAMGRGISSGAQRLGESFADGITSFDQGLNLGLPVDTGSGWEAAANRSMGYSNPNTRMAPPLSSPDQIRSEWDAAESRSPIGSAVGDTLGALANPVSRLSPMASGGLEAGIRKYGQGGSPEEIMMSAAEGGMGGKLMEKLGQGIDRTQAWAKDELAPDMRSRKNINRVAASGVYGTDLAAMEKNKGEDFIQSLGEDIEKHGLHNGPGFLGKIIPQKAETYGVNANRLRGQGLDKMSGAEDLINSQSNPPQVDYMPAANQMLDGAVKTEGIRHFDAPGEMAQRENFAYQLAGPAAEDGVRPFDKALADRRFYDDQINWQGRGGYKGAGTDERLTREAAGNVRGAIRQGLDDSVLAGDTPPELRDQWVQGKDEYAIGAAVADPAIARKYREYGNQPLSLGALAASGGDLATAATAQAIKHRGRSALAGFQGGVMDAANSVGNSEALSNAAGALQSGTGGVAASFYGSDRTQDPFTAPKGGHELEQAVNEILYSQPDILGKYRGDFEYAGRSPGGIANLLYKLQDQDNVFRTQILPKIRGGYE